MAQSQETVQLIPQLMRRLPKIRTETSGFADTPQTTVGDNPNNAYMTNFTKESQTRDTTTNATSNSTIHQTDETDETETTDTDRKLNGTEDTVGNITDERTKTSQLNRDVDTKATNDGFENGSSSQDNKQGKTDS